MRAHIYTWLASIIAVIVIAAAWLTIKPLPKMVRVDIGEIVKEQQETVAKELKPGMSQDAQQALLAKVAANAQKLSDAVQSLSAECRCAVLNSAAIIATPEGSAGGVPDATERLRALMSNS